MATMQMNNNDENEKNLLATLLLDNSIIDMVSGKITKDHFSNATCKKIYIKMCEQWKSDKHFDQITYNFLILIRINNSQRSYWNSDYPTDHLNDINDIDTLGNNVLYKLKMYNQMYYLSKYYAGYKASDVVDYFRINNGI